jgi:large subunit ribosomal protein L9
MKKATIKAVKAMKKKNPEFQKPKGLIPVLLNRDIDNLGDFGAEVWVKPGYAKNYLFPNNLVVEYNEHNINLLKSKMKKYEEQRNMEKLSAEEQKQRIENLNIVIERKSGEKGVLYGSVNVSDIEEELKKIDIVIERKKFNLKEPIKKLGKFTCKIRLFKDVEAELNIEINPEGGEMEPLTEAEESNYVRSEDVYLED